MKLPPELREALERLQAGITDAADLETLRRALQAGQIVLATGARAVAIGGSVEDTVIVTGDNTIVSVFKGATAESVREALQKVLERIASDHYAASLQEYFRALRRYCAELPYLTLTDIRPTKNLDDVYVPLRLRQWKKKTLLPKPAAQGESLTVEQVLHQSPTSHLLILGQQGAGKSTLLRQLAERAYDDPHSIGLERPHLPLLLPLRALARAEGALEERLNQTLSTELSPHLTRPLPDGFFDAWPQQLDAPWLFLLDGLDEVPADKHLSLKQWIGDLLAHPDVARVIITSRPAVYTEKEWEPSRLSVYEILPFIPDQTAELARRWFGKDAPAFLQALETVRSGVLTETPLLLTIAAKVYLERKKKTGTGSLPERRSQLYQVFVDTWLDEARERGLRDELDADLLDLAQPTLAHLALAMTDHPDWTDEESLKPVVAQYLDEQLNLKARAPAVAERFLRVMARRSGVFLKREEQYSWVHLSFREYFAALALNQQLESGKSFEEALGERAIQKKWDETIVVLAEVCAQARELVAWLIKRAKTEDGKGAFLAWKCWKASGVEISKEKRVDLSNALVSSLRVGGEDSFYAALVVGDIADAHSVKRLINMLSEQDKNVCWLATIALKKLGDPRTVHPLIELLRDEESCRWDAVDALVEIGTPAVKPLIALLRNANEDVRNHVAEALGRIGDSRAVKPLIQLLYNENTRWTAARALVKIGAPAIKPLIAVFYETEQNLRERTAVKVEETWLADLLTPSLAYSEWEIGWMVVHILKEIGEIAVEPLIDALSNRNEGIRWGAAITLGEIGDTRAIEPLIGALGDSNLNVVWSAVLALGKIGTPAVGPLVDVLHTSSKVPKWRVERALVQIGPPVVESLTEVLGDANENVRKCAIDVLGEIRDVRAVEPLGNVFLNSGEYATVREKAAKALVKIGSAAVQPLTSALSHPKAWTRRVASESLGEIADNRAVDPLIAALDDPEVEVRMQVAKALGNIGDPRALPALEQVLRKAEEKRKTSTSSIWLDLLDALDFTNTAAREAIARIRARMAQTDPQGDE